MDTKECSKCGEVRALDAFGNNKANKDGKQCQCKSCVKSYQIANKEKIAKQRASHYKENKQEILSRNSSWRSANKDKIRRISKGYGKAHRSEITARGRAYKIAKKQGTPSWANDQLIAAYYKEAKRLEELTGIQFHVDHIIPLQGELVSGLHVETNLQLLPAHENLGKSNRFDPETFCA